MIIRKYFKQTCGPCKQLDPILTKICEEKGITLTAIDVDDLTTEQKQELKLKSVPTLHILKNEDEGSKTVVTVGFVTELAIRQIIDAL